MGKPKSPQPTLRPLPAFDQPHDPWNARFVSTKEDSGIVGALVGSIFHQKLLASLEEQTKDLLRNYVDLFGAVQGPKRLNQKLVELEKGLSVRTGKGAPPGPRDLQRDNDILLWFRRFEAAYPEVKGRRLRTICAEFLHENAKTEFGPNVDAIVTQLDRILKRRADKK